MKKLLYVVLLLSIVVPLLLCSCTVGQIAEGNAQELGAKYMIHFADDTFCFADEYSIQDGVLVLHGYYRVNGNGGLEWRDKDLVASGGYHITQIEAK